MSLTQGYSVTDLLAVARAGSGWSFGPDGVLVDRGANALRPDWDPATGVFRGLLVEQQATNLIPNPTASGAVVGGSLPTDWSGVAGGLSAAISWTGTMPDGTPGVEYTISGTSNGNPQAILCVQGSPPTIPAAPSVGVWSSDVGIEVLAAAGGNVRHWLSSLNATGGLINSNSFQSAAIAPGSPYARYQLLNRVLSNVNTAGATTGIRIDGVTNGVAFSARIRISFPQLTGLPIAMSLAAGTRNADAVTMIDVGRWLTVAQGTVVIDVTPGQTTDATPRGIIALDDGTANNRIELYMDAATPVVRLTAVAGGVTVINGVAIGTAAALARSTLRLSWGPAGWFVSLDGAAPITSAAALVPALSRVRLGNRGGAATDYLNGWIGPRVEYHTRQYTDAPAADGYTIRTR